MEMNSVVRSEIADSFCWWLYFCFDDKIENKYSYGNSAGLYVIDKLMQKLFHGFSWIDSANDFQWKIDIRSRQFNH